jgi:hypothetical protein
MSKLELSDLLNTISANEATSINSNDKKNLIKASKATQ